MEEMKKCPNCGEYIMKVAKKCRHCGEWLDESVDHQNSHYGKSSQRHRSFQKNNIAKYIILGMGIIAVVVVAIALSTNHETEDPLSTEEAKAVIPPAENPYTVDQVIENLEEYDANETEEEKAQEPWRICLNELQGSYLIDMTDLDMIHTYGKYVISGNTITKYEWNENSNSWTREFSSEFQLFKFQEDDYMTGYNLIYTDQYGNECRMCSGDTNGDGKMDLWSSDSMFWTKQ